MAKALEYSKVFRALLDGGYICSICNVSSGVTEYAVWTSEKKGHITEKQMRELENSHVVEMMREMSFQKDKAGNIYCYYGKATALDVEEIMKKAVMNYAVAVLYDVNEAARQEDSPVYEGDKEIDMYLRLSDVEHAINKHLNEPLN